MEINGVPPFSVLRTAPLFSVVLRLAPQQLNLIGFKPDSNLKIGFESQGTTSP